MRSLIIGILLFLIWSALSTWYYSSRILSPDVGPEPVTEKIDQQVIPAAESEELTPPEEFRIHFAFDRYDFTPDEKLDTFLEDCKNYLLNDTSSCLIITGHTDAKGTDAYNMKLGNKRAESVKEYLFNMGFSNSCMQISSEGESKPVADNSTEDGRARNRRVELLINQ